MKEYTAQEVIKDLPDLWMALNVLLVADDQLVLPDGEICEYFIVKVYLVQVHRFLTTLIFLLLGCNCAFVHLL